MAPLTDGLPGWRVDPEPLLSPSTDVPSEAWGVEDPRVVRLDELDAWAVAYTHDAATDELRLYYGAADTCVAMAHAPRATSSSSSWPVDEASAP